MKNILHIILLTFLLCGCKTSTVEKIENNSDLTNLSLTSAQVKLADIATGTIQKRDIEELIQVTGRIEANPDKRAKVSSMYNAYIETILVHNGQQVRKGEKLLVLTHPDFINLQRDYLQAFNEMELLTSQYNRQQKLKEQNAETIKIFEEVQSAYKTKSTDLQALEMQLKLLHINTENVLKNGIDEHIHFEAPISGIVNNLAVTLGQLVSPDDILLEIVSDDDFHIELNVFEKNINRVSVGQKVYLECTVPESDHEDPVAVITHISNLIDSETKTFNAYAHPNKIYPGMRHGLFLNAEIVVKSVSVNALPSNSIFTRDNSSFVFIAQNDSSFTLTKVKTGIQNNDYIEIDTDIFNKNIVIHGVNYLSTLLSSE